MQNQLFTETVRGLIATAYEKWNVQGTRALDDIIKMKQVVEDMVKFWNLDIALLDEWNEGVAMQIGPELGEETLIHM